MNVFSLKCDHELKVMPQKINIRKGSAKARQIFVLHLYVNFEDRAYAKG